MTHVILDTDDNNYVQEVAEHLGDCTIIEGLPWVELATDHEAPTHVFYGQKFGDTVQDRMIQIGLAGSGTILLSDDDKVPSPLYAGMLPSPARAKVYLDHAKKRAEMFRVKGLTYAGPTWQDPKNVLVLDGIKSQALTLMSALLTNASPNWWPSTGFIREVSNEALSETIDERFYYSSIVAFSRKDLDRIHESGRTDGVLDATDIKLDDPKMAVKLRTLTYRPESFEEVIDTNYRSNK